MLGVDGAQVVALDGDALRARCASPLFRRGVFVGDDATVHPARLALGLRERVIARGALVFERSRVRALRAGGDVVAETDGGSVRAGSAVVAINASARGFAPLRHRLAVTSSHIVLTEPVPDVLEQLGWTGGESITDARTFVHYFRTHERRPDRVRLGRRAARRRGATARPRRGRPRRRSRDPPRTSTHLHLLLLLLPPRGE